MQLDRDLEIMRQHWEADNPAVEEPAEREDLCRRIVEAVRVGNEALAVKLVREYVGLPPELTR